MGQKTISRIGHSGLGVGEIDVPEGAWMPFVCHQGPEEDLRPAGCPVPVDGPAPGNIVRQRDSGNAMDNRLAHGRDGPGVMNVRPQVAAGIDPCQHPARFWGQVMECQSTQSAGVPAMARHPSSGRVTRSGPSVVTRCPHPETGSLGATTRQCPSGADARRKAARPGASQPSSFVKIKVGSMARPISVFSVAAISLFANACVERSVDRG